MRRPWLVLALAVLALPFASTLAGDKVPKADPAKAAVEVRALLDEQQRAFDRKDAAWFKAHNAPDADTVSFGTDAAEIWVGWDPLRKAIDDQLKAAGPTQWALRDVRVKVHASGEVAYASYLLDLKGTSGGQPFDVKGMRVLGVLERRAGTWVYVASHASMPVDGQLVKY
jgi:ketosteroid isomerase-like protein